jgi:hypothetical protein
MNEVASAGPRPQAPPRTVPVFSLDLTLNTEFAARVYRRCFDRLKADLYVLTVRTRAASMAAEAKAIEMAIAGAFEAVREDLDAELERSDGLLDEAKLTDLPAYDGVPTTNATYSTPQAREFLELLLKMDQLLMRYDALWLGQRIDTQQRWSRCQNWQRRLTKVANRLRELGNRTRAALTKEAEKHAGAAASISGAQPAVASPNVETLETDNEYPRGDDHDEGRLNATPLERDRTDDGALEVGRGMETPALPGVPGKHDAAA